MNEWFKSTVKWLFPFLKIVQCTPFSAPLGYIWFEYPHNTEDRGFILSLQSPEITHIWPKFYDLTILPIEFGPVRVIP